MEVLYSRNVEDAYAQGIDAVRAIGEKQHSRVGDVLVAPHPVMTVYDYPQERVLLDPSRDANPFFHIFEALWILAGRDDAKWLDQFVSDFSSRFAEDNGFIYGAYGYRFRYKFKFDQLRLCIQKLKKNPLDRRVVLQMWDPSSDLAMGEGAKDLPCNTQIYPRIIDNRLDLTICCRSNDIIWGAYGANAVHFSVLQEYLAGHIGVGVGRMYQLSNNWHAYTDMLKKVGEPTHEQNYAYGVVHNIPMGEQWEYWDEDLKTFMDWADHPDIYPAFANSWFHNIACPMFAANYYWKMGDRSRAIAILEDDMEPCDWRVAASQWFERRDK